MPETPSPAGQQVIALAMMFSAIALTAVAFLIYTSVIPMGEDTRPVVTIVVGVAAFADLLIGIWFFRRGQSS